MQPAEAWESQLGEEQWAPRGVPRQSRPWEGLTTAWQHQRAPWASSWAPGCQRMCYAGMMPAPEE